MVCEPTPESLTLHIMVAERAIEFVARLANLIGASLFQSPLALLPHPWYGPREELGMYVSPRLPGLLLTGSLKPRFRLF